MEKGKLAKSSLLTGGSSRRHLRDEGTSRTASCANTGGAAGATTTALDDVGEDDDDPGLRFRKGKSIGADNSWGRNPMQRQPSSNPENAVHPHRRPPTSSDEARADRRDYATVCCGMCICLRIELCRKIFVDRIDFADPFIRRAFRHYREEALRADRMTRYWLLAYLFLSITGMWALAIVCMSTPHHLFEVLSLKFGSVAEGWGEVYTMLPMALSGAMSVGLACLLVFVLRQQNGRKRRSRVQHIYIPVFLRCGMWELARGGAGGRGVIECST